MSTDQKNGAALRVLAGQVDDLTRQLGALRDQLGAGVESAETKADAALRAIAKVTDALSALTATPDGDGDQADEDEDAGIASWMTVRDPEQARAMIAELAEWLAAVYVRYPGGQLGDCWPWHPSVVAELLALRDIWVNAHEGKTASAAAVMDWHDRYRPGAAARVTAELAPCGLEKHSGPVPAGHRPVTVPGEAMLGQLAQWAAETWGTAAAPQPTPDLLAAARARRTDETDY